MSYTALSTTACRIQGFYHCVAWWTGHTQLANRWLWLHAVFCSSWVVSSAPLVCPFLWYQYCRASGNGCQKWSHHKYPGWDNTQKTLLWTSGRVYTTHNTANHRAGARCLSTITEQRNTLTGPTEAPVMVAWHAMVPVCAAVVLHGIHNTRGACCTTRWGQPHTTVLLQCS